MAQIDWASRRGILPRFRASHPQVNCFCGLSGAGAVPAVGPDVAARLKCAAAPFAIVGNDLVIDTQGTP